MTRKRIMARSAELVAADKAFRRLDNAMDKSALAMIGMGEGMQAMRTKLQEMLKALDVAERAQQKRDGAK